jgi:G:T/U-mismatch repair DNA glycosylase
MAAGLPASLPSGSRRRTGYQTIVLPSTSPAYTLAFERKVEFWRAAGLGEMAPD